MNVALVLSGGVGSRMGTQIPKQYIKVKEHMIIEYCLRTLEECEEIDAIQIVAEQEWQRALKELKLQKLRGFSCPGETRQISILNGVRDIISYAADSDAVLIHDAARPFLTEKMILSLLKALPGHDGVMPVLPMKDTVYYSEDGKKVTSLLDRRCIFAGQAPEIFYLGRYFKANTQLTKEQLMMLNGSTEPAVLQGMDIALIHGDENNFKITTKEDLERFQMIVRNL